MNKISVAITTFNNEDTIETCLNSLDFADEVIVVDSNSSDKTLEIANRYQCKVFTHDFLGYAKQKQLTIDYCNNDWVLLLDSDESIDEDSLQRIQHWQNQTPEVYGYRLPRREWVFWKWSNKLVHMNDFIRLFNKNKSQMSQDLVHESVHIEGKAKPLNVVINHMSDTSISKKIAKINQYSTLSAEQKYKAGNKVGVLKILFSPWFYFFKQLILRRQVFNGVAGFINAALNTYYAFLKHSKLYELQKSKN